MNKIIKKERLNENVSKIIVESPQIARAAQPGQFIVVIPTPTAERIPLTIADTDKEAGTITIIFQIVGATTKLLDTLDVGGEIPNLLGPLGQPTHIEKYGTVVVIGGGVGIAEIYPMVKALEAAGNEVITIIGARNKDLLIYEKELSAVSSRLLVTTDDGSSGRKGFVSDELLAIIAAKKTINLVFAVGPVPMMRVCADVTRAHNIKTVVSLNPIMLDATGMCGVCRVTVGGQTKFACVDGPEFDGHAVDFAELISRLKTFRAEEQQALDHVCKLVAGVKR